MITDPSIAFLLALAGGYLIGSVPFGLVLTKAAGLGDIRAIGSGNIGATNVLRTGRKGLAAATLLLDGLKGVAAVLLLRWVAGEQDLVAGTAAVLGHTFPVWLAFRGGKGVATGLGVYLAAMWPVGLACCAVWLVAARVTRISSAGALAAFAAAPLLALLLSDAEHALLALLVGVLIVWRHEANIRRLLAGTEPRIGQKG
ncbi:glycerol-3-phosphate 1-O-acyltransferase PlsY [Roseomonas alkaliterrae]|uniref:Glycerol-3-phosphate acyltransferase n=1 Tax=Neoroseomonas alkaliterrae TaxID=1452450 RepID=A0A840YB65_9PROT|nr:glycerol-3-phosphate 1-O-acyltransferase PlsY [Neoroseomonas alkaliterrae]MBB5691213.1 glycerol-3-phosphate acyltransferase PlsY [Neoroseomonas alkaliterrae]MBR0677962.1 glycerol-3-phosphate 1-O-acyltransferase PlsY [Neoroseomonas alkaliterrae]